MPAPADAHGGRAPLRQNATGCDVDTVYQKMFGSSTVNSKRKLTKSEGILLGLTALFLCVLSVLSLRDRAAPPGLSVRSALAQEAAESAVLDLNTATAQELSTLPGIGPELARRIVSYREEHGPFTAAEELMEVPGIGPGKFSAVADSITVEDGT